MEILAGLLFCAFSYACIRRGSGVRMIPHYFLWYFLRGWVVTFPSILRLICLIPTQSNNKKRLAFSWVIRTYIALRYLFAERNRIIKVINSNKNALRVLFYFSPRVILFQKRVFFVITLFVCTGKQENSS